MVMVKTTSILLPLRIPSLGITGFINTACEKDRSEGGIDFWMILGDNFYDRSGELSSQFFSMLTAKAKSKIFAASPGNHDYWVGGSPLISVKGKDQFANGFMQYYAMDAEASKDDSVNFLAGSIERRPLQAKG